MASENQYKLAQLELRGGLDFVSPALATGSTTLSECLNFEVTDRLGYSRIGGYERFDNSPYNSSLLYTNTVLIVGGPGDLIKGEGLENTSPLLSKKDQVFGYYLDHTIRGEVMPDGTVVNVSYLIVVVTNYTAFFTLVPGTSSFAGVVSGETQLFENSVAFKFIDAKLQVGVINDDYFYPHNRTRTAPGESVGTAETNGPITGLHWYKENLYAITDYIVYAFTAGETAIYSGDILSGSSPQEGSARIIDYKVESGSFEDGDATGYILLQPLSGDLNSLEATVVRPGGAEAALRLLSRSNEPSWGAGMFKTKNAGGWEEVGMGYEFAFTGGTSNGPPPVFQRGSGNAITIPVSNISPPSTATTGGTPSWTLEGGATSVLDAVSTDDQKYVQVSTAVQRPQTILQVKDFVAVQNIPEDSEITGFSIKISCAGINSDPTKQPYFTMRAINNTGQLGNVKATPMVRTTAGAFTAADIYTVGSPTDTWGITDVRAAMADGFGFNIVPISLAANASVTQYQINYVELNVFYSGSVETFYFWNGEDDILAPITSVYKDSGKWEDNDAHGFMQVASITPVAPGTRTYITPGDQIRTSPGGGGALIAYVESAAQYATLPSLPMLQAKRSRYQMITANFYGSEEWETIYGVSGAGQAFAYDGFYFRRIYTGLVATLDMPRHIAFHQHHLVLGYAAGNVTLSVEGEPENFDGIQGAASFDLGDPVTGLLRMNGTALGVFCQSSISTLMGTNIDNLSVTMISPNEGAIEYTLVDCGKPIYCSNKGISLFDQTAAYGDFLGSRMSAAITSWLLPRLQGTRSPLDTNFSFTSDTPPSGGATGVMFATVCRTKNQYRLYFSDGVCLTMTLSGQQQDQEFTLQKYDMWNMPADKADAEKYGYFIPLAASSAIDKYGRERIHMSHYDGGRSALNGNPSYYAYEFERSWSFAGQAIPCNLTINEVFFGNPFDIDTVRKIRTHGLSMGYAPIKIAVNGDYDHTNPPPYTYVDTSLPRNAVPIMYTDLMCVTNIANMDKRGRSFNVELLYDDNFVCPPFCVQALLIQYIEGKGDV